MKSALVSLFLWAVAQADIVHHDWNLEWKTISPNGLTPKPIITVNGQWPPPAIVASEGDRIIVKVKNQLGNETASIHFHGMYQKGQNHMDGPVGATQCPIPPGSSFTYDFTVRLLEVITVL
jgi:iron transport multicopper oxidase